MEALPSPRELVAAALAGRAVSRVPRGPLAVHYCARDAGVPLREYTLDARRLADCVVRYARKYRPDAVWVSADTWVTAEAMGAAVVFPDGDQPLGGSGVPRVVTAADVDRIPPADPETQGRMPLMREALARVKGELGEEFFVVACLDQAPFTLACALLGIDRAMLALYDDRPLIEALLERCVEYGAAYGSSLAAAGADLLSTGDSAAGLIGPALYRDVALPAERALFAELREATDTPLSLHVCGDARPILAGMASSGAEVLELDSEVDLREARRLAGPELVLWGNVDPVGVLQQGTPEDVRAAVSEALDAATSWGGDRFVLSSGCTIAPETPEANLRALIQGGERRPS